MPELIPFEYEIHGIPCTVYLREYGDEFEREIEVAYVEVNGMENLWLGDHLDTEDVIEKYLAHERACAEEREASNRMERMRELGS